MGAIIVGIREAVTVGANGVSVVRGVASRDEDGEEEGDVDGESDAEAVRDEMSIVIVVEAAPEGRGDGSSERVGRIIELVLLSVNLGMEIDDEGGEDIRLPAVAIGDGVGVGGIEVSESLELVDFLDVVVGTEELEPSSCPPTLVPGLVAAGGTICVGVSVTGSRSDAGPVNVLGGDEASRRDDGVGVSGGVEVDDVDGSKLVKGVVGSGVEELLDVLSDAVVSVVSLAVDCSRDDARLDAGDVKETRGIDLDEKADELEGIGVSKGVPNEEVVASTLVPAVVEVDNGTPVSIPVLELDPSIGMIVTAGTPA